MSEVVRVQRFLPTNSERLFEYFLKPELAQLWVAPAEMVAITRELNPIVGGKYSFDLRGRGGVWKWEGYFCEIIPNILLIMFDSALTDPSGEELMTNIETKIEFNPQDSGTEVTLLQTGFFSSEIASTSEISWQQRFSNLVDAIDDENNSEDIVRAEPVVI